MHIRLTIAYDGTNFHGLAPQPEIRTVVGSLADALATITQASPPEIVMSGRTDLGVHAAAQVLSCEIKDGFDLEKIRHSLNRILSPEIVVKALEPTDADFSARYSATSRTYRYRILNSHDPDPFVSKYSWHVNKPLNVEVMQQAANYLIGEHDFKSFCRKDDRRMPGPDGNLIDVLAPTTRLVTQAEWTKHQDELIVNAETHELLVFQISANAFCHQMVRAIVGMCVAAGLGKIKASDVPNILDAKDRNFAPQIAPAHGLTLWQVGY